MDTLQLTSSIRPFLYTHTFNIMWASITTHSLFLPVAKAIFTGAYTGQKVLNTINTSRLNSRQKKKRYM